KLLAAECAELSTRARRWLREEAPTASASTIVHSADLRYVGQAFQIEVPIDPAWLEAADTERLRAAFHDLHERLPPHADRAARVVPVRPGDPPPGGGRDRPAPTHPRRHAEARAKDRARRSWPGHGAWPPADSLQETALRCRRVRKTRAPGRPAHRRARCHRA